jgi:hypothetical protein
MTAVLCWCPECTPGNQRALKRDRRVREFAAQEGDQFAESVGLLYGSYAGKAVSAALAKIARPELTKREENGPVAHITGQGGTDYDAFSARLVSQAVGAVVGGVPVPALNKSTPPPGAPADQWARLLTVHARACAGDPVAVSSWAAIEMHSPGLARLVVKAAGVTTATKVTKRKRDRGPADLRGSSRDEDLAAYLDRVGAPASVHTALVGKSAPRSGDNADPEFTAYLARQAASGNNAALSLLIGD